MSIQSALGVVFGGFIFIGLGYATVDIYRAIRNRRARSKVLPPPHPTTERRQYKEWEKTP